MTLLSDLARPWRRFPLTVAFYAVMWIVGAVILTVAHVLAPPCDRVAAGCPLYIGDDPRPYRIVRVRGDEITLDRPAARPFGAGTVFRP